MNDRYESFAVRLWVTGRGIAHGEVIRAADGTRTRFRDPNDIVEFIERCLSNNRLTPVDQSAAANHLGRAAAQRPADEDSRAGDAHLGGTDATSTSMGVTTEDGGAPEQT